MAERDESFLSRWSRLKRRETEEIPAPQPDPATEAVPATAPEAPAGPSPEVEAEAGEHPDAGLPPIEELDRDSDYTGFMRAGVTPELRKQALRKLWRSNPDLANLDGLLEYGEDYSLPFKRGGVVSTIYRVGKGMVQAVEDEMPAKTAAAAPESETPLDAPTQPETQPESAEPPAAQPPAESAADDSADAKNEEDDDIAIG